MFLTKYVAIWQTVHHQWKLLKKIPFVVWFICNLICLPWSFTSKECNIKLTSITGRLLLKSRRCFRDDIMRNTQAKLRSYASCCCCCWWWWWWWCVCERGERERERERDVKLTLIISHLCKKYLRGASIELSKCVLVECPWWTAMAISERSFLFIFQGKLYAFPMWLLTSLMWNKTFYGIGRLRWYKDDLQTEVQI